MYPRYLEVRGGPRYTVRGAGRLAPGTPNRCRPVPPSRKSPRRAAAGSLCG
jgi:hypothetical protein